MRMPGAKSPQPFKFKKEEKFQNNHINQKFRLHCQSAD
jgi:hypothetical protein